MSEIKKFIEEALPHFHSGEIRTGESIICDGIEVIVPKIVNELHVTDHSSISHLVHYTGMDVVFAMLDEKDKKSGLRLYDTIHGNDPEEGRYILRNWPERDDIEPLIWQDNATSHTNDYQGLSFKDKVERGLYPGHAYVLSFVPSRHGEKNNDRIVFWREYGRQGAGCSLSIPIEKLSEKKICPLVPYRVLYGQKPVNELAKKLNDRLIEPIEAMVYSVNNPKVNLKDAIQPKLREQLQLFRYLYKDIAYKNEKEFRLVVPEFQGESKVGPKYQIQANLRGEKIFRHYLMYDSLHSNKIFGSDSQVILGPTVPHKENVQKVIQALLTKSKIDGTVITSSEIRYRGR